MIIKTQNLNGAALDWAVAKACGYTVEVTTLDFFDNPIEPCVCILDWDTHPELDSTFFTPSANWVQGGVIIERERITLNQGHDFMASIWKPDGVLGNKDWYKFKQTGTTPLIAAMRCYVVSKLGNEVDVPEELT
jgi:hypothetical protein